MKQSKDAFVLARFTQKNYETTTLVLAVIVATTTDANTKLKCDKALKALRKLKRIVKSKETGKWQKRKKRK